MSNNESSGELQPEIGILRRINHKIEESIEGWRMTDLHIDFPCKEELHAAVGLPRGADIKANRR